MCGDFRCPYLCTTVKRHRSHYRHAIGVGVGGVASTFKPPRLRLRQGPLLLGFKISVLSQRNAPIAMMSLKSFLFRLFSLVPCDLVSCRVQGSLQHLWSWAPRHVQLKMIPRNARIMLTYFSGGSLSQKFPSGAAIQAISGSLLVLPLPFCMGFVRGTNRT